MFLPAAVLRQADVRTSRSEGPNGNCVSWVRGNLMLQSASAVLNTLGMDLEKAVGRKDEDFIRETMTIYTRSPEIKIRQ